MHTHTGNEDHAVAVVGVACRLPGGIDGPDALWQALVDGRDLVGEAPSDRFDLERFTDRELPRPGKGYTTAGGYLDDLASFDAAHFGISPKEAGQMDPQHRLLLELAAEALDDAGLARESLAGSDTAVFVGISDNSYGGLQMVDPRAINAYTMSGAASSIAANRISYCFDLHGPSMAVDTACSSSLVAIDQACRAVLGGTSRTALCGGVNALVSPYHYVGFSQASMLSRKGRCSAFSAEADGFVRAEGGGLVVLKRLADARADGDRIHAVVRASGSNSDGRTVGLSLPKADTQEELLRSVYDRAGLASDDVAYFEAHGTGTPVGDPVECLAIGRALGRHRTSGPLAIGSVKTNVGHLEPASGIVGLLKAVLVLRHRLIPPSLHADPPNPDIDSTGLGLEVVTAPRPLPDADRVVVGVNSFGFGGANAHVVLAAPPEPEPVEPRGDEPRPVLVSASTSEALEQATADLVDHLGRAGDFYDLAYTTCVRRGHHRHRRAVLAANAAEAARLLPDAPPVEAVTGGRIGFVYSGNASQWAGMGADLLSDRDFLVAVEQVDAALATYLGWSVLDRLGTVTDVGLAATEVAQPLLFAVQVDVTEVLRANGIAASAVLGHSVGEVAAAWAAGALSLDQAAWVVAERSRAQAPTSGGRMAAVPLSAEELHRLHPAAGIAGVNTPKDVTVAGTAEEIAALVEDLAGHDVTCTDLGLDYAFHTAAMDQVREPLCAALDGRRRDPAAGAGPRRRHGRRHHRADPAAPGPAPVGEDFLVTARRPARASLVDTVALGALVLVPSLAQGAILRRRRMVGLAARWDTNGLACRLLRRLRDKHGTGPLLVRVLHRRVLLLLSPQDARQALEQTTISLTAASRDKVATLGHFEPEAVLLSRGLVREERRRFNEVVLDYPKTDHRLCPAFDVVVREEAATLISRTTGRGAELTWDEFVHAYRRIVRRIVLGDAAADDEQLTALLNALRADANWFRLRPRRERLREELWDRVRGYLDAGSGGLAACVADAPQTPRTLPQAQAQHWLFAFDAAPIATFLALGLLAGHPAKSRTDHDYLRACVRESLRLWPTTLAILRDTTRRTTWSDGSTVPEGTAVVYYSSYFHRDDSRLPYADRFEPEVWLDGRAGEDRALAPFSRGPAECPGQHLVLFTSATLLSALLDQGLRQVGGVLLTPNRPLPRTADHHALRFA